jgi:hypothetical protein
MKIFDELILKTNSLLSDYVPRVFKADLAKSAPEGSKNELVLGRDCAYELGAASLDSVNLTLVTNDAALVPKSEIVLYGQDLTELKQDSPYARITLLLTDNIEEHGDEGAYSIIKNIELKKFDASPAGYMVRASGLSNREQVRVSKAAVKSGLSFEQVGNLFIGKYTQNKHVQAVKNIFVTLPEAPYRELDSLADSASAITKALNHALADLKMDCRACEWKPVCDTVEGMKDLHEKLIHKDNLEE